MMMMMMMMEMMMMMITMATILFECLATCKLGQPPCFAQCIVNKGKIEHFTVKKAHYTVNKGKLHSVERHTLHGEERHTAHCEQRQTAQCKKAHCTVNLSTVN